MKTQSQWLFEAPFPSQSEREYYSYPDAMAVPTYPWPRRLNQARQQIANAHGHLQSGNTRAFHNALDTAQMYLDEAEVGIKKRISPSPRLVGVQVEIHSAKFAIAQARKNQPNKPQEAANDLRKAVSYIQAARDAIGLYSIR